MRVKRIFLIVTMLTAGAVIARPDDVLPLAARLAAPLITHRDAPPAVTESPTLPEYVNTKHDLSFPAKEAAALPEASLRDAPASSAAVTAPALEAAPQAPAPVQIMPMLPDDPSGDASAAAPAGDQPAEAASGDASAPAGAPTEGPAGGMPVATAGRPVVAAKSLFGAVKGPSLLQARAIGSYARGCLAGAEALPIDGPAWQAMRLSRNRNWGHPKLVKLVERLATTAQKEDGWPGLLVGDLSQPRGGPMLTGHASHQIGLDADVWLTPMPARKFTREEREKVEATSMLDKTDIAVDPKVFTAKQVKLIKRAASFAEVERVLVHPAIKKALCKAAGTDRAWLGKVRPIQGHYYHMHIRIACPSDSAGCVPQKPPTGEDGCGKEVEEWIARVTPKPPSPPVPGAKPRPPAPPIVMAQLPPECRNVVESGPDGIQVPPEALLAAAPVHRHGRGARQAAVNVILKSAKARR